VGYIEDSSGNGHHIQQTTAGKRPIFKTSGGLNWLEGTGAAGARGLSSVNTIDMTATNNVTICAGVTRDTASTGCIVEHTANAGTTNGGYWLFFDGGNVYSTFGKGSLAFSANTFVTTAAITAPNTRVLVATNPIDSFSKIRENTVSRTAVSSTKGTGNYANATLYIGSRANTSEYIDGNIYSLFAYTDIKTGADLTAIETYLAEKSGVTL
jgi:hypothetical protein